MSRYGKIFAVWAWVLAGTAAHGQQALETFGKNRIQYKVFQWKYLSAQNFDVYYYDERKKVAEDALQFLESEFDRITDLIGYPPYLKTKVFLYSSITDQQQSNVGLNHNPFTSGGETEFVKPYVEIAHPGTLEQFKEELLLRTAELMINEMMFGGNLRDIVQNSVLLNLPDWFVDGAANYVARGWSADMDDYVRQLIVSKKVNQALKLSGPEAALIGQSIWNYIVEKYGKGSVSNILNYTRIMRNEQRSILITLGIPFKQLMAEWQNYYGTQEKRVRESYQAPADSLRFSPRHRRSVSYTTVKISPDGKKIAYAENDRGRFHVMVKSLENGRETTVLQGGNRAFRQRVDNRVPLLNWADPNTLGVITINKGNYVFWLYDLTTKNKLPRELDQYSNIRSFDFSGNGRLAVLSADQNGQNDLYLISSRRDRTRRLTNDVYDDLDPAFIPNTNTLIFSSNRVTDTLSNKTEAYQKLPASYNLFAYDLDTTRTRVKRLTNTLSRDYNPRPMDAQNIFYLSDQRGIVNLFRFNTESGTYTQVTNYNASIKEYDVNFYDRKLALVMVNRLREDIFIDNNFSWQRQIFTPATRRKEIQQAKSIVERIANRPPERTVSIKDLINNRLREKKDTVPPTPAVLKDTVRKSPPDSTQTKTINTDEYQFEDEKPAQNPAPSTAPPATVPNKPVVNTEDYVFEDEVLKTRQPTETFLTRYMKAREVNRVAGPFRYEPKFAYESLVTSFVVDPLRGFSFRAEVQMNDMLENYRFLGGIQSAFDFRSGDAYGEFQFLPMMVDLSARIDRRVIFWETPQQDAANVELHKYTWQKLELGASLPLSVRTRISLKPFIGYTRLVDRGLRERSSLTFRPAEEQWYTGGRAEVVYDNSLTTGMNIIEGTRAKLSFVHYEASGNGAKSFSQVSADVRHYQKIYKEIVLAVRGFAGSFFGNSPKNYMLGGMDNWIANRANYEGLNNPLTNRQNTFNEGLLFHEFATSLRGFDYATLYGRSAALANVELRVPLVRALASGPITSNFFRHMQLTAFYDVGSSWTGEIPFREGNSVRQRVVPENTSGSPFRVELNEYINPWLYSYGAGFRSMMLGYYLKFDVAWPVVNYEVQNIRFHATLGFDF
ncbi:MAG: translocation protein TolB [Cyclobacteriaceae bacterium]|jgi:Tol biopolymer transport system component|nr:translocation protein TolB [Cyclobacteriaceae bacterium]